MSAESEGEVSGPVATITGPSRPRGTAGTSSRTTATRGWLETRRVTSPEKRWRSTASAAPAGTRLASAARITTDPRRRISSLRTPTALSSLSPRNELLQTSSAS